jgi:putative heme iron utilization protein
VEIVNELVRELAKNEKMMWVVGGGEVVSENDAKGIKEPELSKGYLTVSAENWHFHLKLESVTGIQFVEAESHGDLKSYYIRFSKGWEETLVRCYFPNPYMDDGHQRTEFQPEKFKEFESMRDRYVGREGIVFVQRPQQPVS